jgi:transcription elongation factor S-II
MDEQALGKRIRTLTKAVNAEPPSVVIKLLEELKEEKAPTEELLRVSLSNHVDLPQLVR